VVDLVAELGLTAVDEGGVRVASGEVAAVFLLAGSGGIGTCLFLFQTGLHLLMTLVQLAFRLFRSMTELFEASASTKLASRKIFLPSTSIYLQ
jgi:hypothetical protein